MDYVVQNMSDLIAAIQSATPDNPDVEIKIIGSFSINQTLNINAATVVNISSSLDPRPVLTRADDFVQELFRVNPGGNLTIREVDLDGNRNDSEMTGSLIFNRGMLNIFDATLRNNSSTGDGGAIIGITGQIDVRNAAFLNNHSNGDGGAICSHSLITLDNSAFISNTAANNGGSLFYDGPGNLNVNGCRFERNTATDGGGIYLSRRQDNVRFDINQDSIFTGNRASGDGGAIWVSDLNILYVESPVIFSNNRASQGYFICPADIPLHQSHIHATVFTAPFLYGYNNFDINYRSGIPYDEDANCSVVGTQTVDLCVPVTVAPSAIAGPTKVRCCGAAVVRPGIECPGIPNPNCSFTISQRICIEVPVEFRAHAVTGPTHTSCGMASGTRTCDEICNEQIEAAEVKF